MTMRVSWTSAAVIDLPTKRFKNRLRLQEFRLSEGVRLYFYELQELVDPVVHRHPITNRPDRGFLLAIP